MLCRANHPELNLKSYSSREIKLRRAAEENGKQLGTERANLDNALRHIAQEQDDLKKLLEREQEQCRLKDELYREQKKQNDAIILQSQKVRCYRAVLSRPQHLKSKFSCKSCLTKRWVVNAI